MEVLNILHDWILEPESRSHDLSGFLSRVKERGYDFIPGTTTLEIRANVADFSGRVSLEEGTGSFHYQFPPVREIIDEIKFSLKDFFEAGDIEFFNLTESASV